MSVAIVEDHPGSGPAMAVMLTRAGYRVTLARSFATGLATIRNDRPHILVTDINLPGGCGLDLIREAKRTISGVACIATTGAAGDMERLAHDAGADAFLLKPIEFDRLFALLPPPRASIGGAE